ncbi:unnamed protein product [Closterium sp. NIES-64]|nr:unnamed protein product [Closterium sp. NIES-64]
MDSRGSAFPAHALRLVAVLLIITFTPAAAGRRIDTLDTTSNANSDTATSVDATAGAAASDLAALAVDAKTRAEIKALAPLMGSADLTGVDKPPERASYLTRDDFAAAAREWIATVTRRVQKLIRQAGGGGKGRGSSKRNSARGNTPPVEVRLQGGRKQHQCGTRTARPEDGTRTAQGRHVGGTGRHKAHRGAARGWKLAWRVERCCWRGCSANSSFSHSPTPHSPPPSLPPALPFLTLPLLPPPDRSLGYVPPTTKDLNPAKLPNLNTVSRYLTVGLTLDPASQKLSWDFKRFVDHRSLYKAEDGFDQGNCGSCWAHAVARAIQGAYALFTDTDTFPTGTALSVQQLVDCTGAAASCRGGYPEAALQYAVKNGLQSEEGYSYTGVNGKCSVNKEAVSFESSQKVPSRYPEAALQYAVKGGLQSEESYAYTGFNGKCGVKKDAAVHVSCSLFLTQLRFPSLTTPRPSPLQCLYTAPSILTNPSLQPLSPSNPSITPTSPSLQPLPSGLRISATFGRTRRCHYQDRFTPSHPVPSMLLRFLPPLTPLHRSQEKWSISMYEQVPLPGPLGLILALQKQPVIVTIRASAQDFIDYSEFGVRLLPLTKTVHAHFNVSTIRSAPLPKTLSNTREAYSRGGTATTPYDTGSTLAAHWQHTGSTLAAHWQHTGSTLAAHWQHTGSTLAAHWQQHTGSTLAAHWQHTGSTLAAHWQHTGSTLAAHWQHTGSTLAAHWQHTGSTLAAHWQHTGSTLAAHWQHTGSTLAAHWQHTGSTLQHTGSTLAAHWQHTGSTLAAHWQHTGSTRAAHWQHTGQHTGSTLAAHWQHTGSTLAAHWQHTGSTLQHTGKHTGSTLAAHWQHNNGSTLAAHWQHTGSTLAAHWQHTGSTLAAHWQHTGSTLAAHWQHTGSTLAAHWQHTGSTLASTLAAHWQHTGSTLGSTLAAHWQHTGSTLAAHWQHTGSTLAAHWQHTGSTLAAHWQHTGSTLAAHWQHTGSTLAAHWQHTGSTLAAHWQHTGSTLAAHWQHTGSTLAAHWQHTGSTLAAHWQHTGSTLAAHWQHTGSTLAAHWQHTGSTLAAHWQHTGSTLAAHSQHTASSLPSHPPTHTPLACLPSQGGIFESWNCYSPVGKGGIFESWNCYSPVGKVWGSEGSGLGATATATNNTGLLDHVMLAVGYNYEEPDSGGNYFILKNSWGPDWGEGGYMRILMESGPFGTCGMLVNRGLYPVVREGSSTPMRVFAVVEIRHAVGHVRFGTCGLARAVWHVRFGTCCLARAVWHVLFGTCCMRADKRGSGSHIWPPLSPPLSDSSLHSRVPSLLSPFTLPRSPSPLSRSPFPLPRFAFPLRRSPFPLSLSHTASPALQSTDPYSTAPCEGGTCAVDKRDSSEYTCVGDKKNPCSTAPCGGGTCEADESGNGKYTCQCSDLLVPAVNRDGTPTCTIIDVCSILPTNPCAVGQCINIGDGGYSCLCPPNYKPSTLASGQTTCVPEMSGSMAAAVQGTYTVQGGETCGAIYGFIGLTQEQFLLQNEGVDCDNLKAGAVLNISIPSSAQVCRVHYTVTQADAAARSCDPINTRFGIDVTTINPSLDCSSLTPNQQICIQVGDAVAGAADYNLCTDYICIQICIQVGDAVAGAADYNLCTDYVTANQWQTCANAVEWYGMTWFDLYRLNPGINCDSLSALTGSEKACDPKGALAFEAPQKLSWGCGSGGVALGGCGSGGVALGGCGSGGVALGGCGSGGVALGGCGSGGVALGGCGSGGVALGGCGSGGVALGGCGSGGVALGGCGSGGVALGGCGSGGVALGGCGSGGVALKGCGSGGVALGGCGSGGVALKGCGSGGVALGGCGSGGVALKGCGSGGVALGGCGSGGVALGGWGCGSGGVALKGCGSGGVALGGCGSGGVALKGCGSGGVALGGCGSGGLALKGVWLWGSGAREHAREHARVGASIKCNSLTALTGSELFHYALTAVPLCAHSCSIMRSQLFHYALTAVPLCAHSCSIMRSQLFHYALTAVPLCAHSCSIMRSQLFHYALTAVPLCAHSCSIMRSQLFHYALTAVPLCAHSCSIMRSQLFHYALTAVPLCAHSCSIMRSQLFHYALTAVPLCAHSCSIMRSQLFHYALTAVPLCAHSSAIQALCGVTLNGLTGSEICIKGTPLGAVACGKARSKTVANRRYTVGAGDSCASLVVVQFQRQPPLVGQLNRGWMCRSQSLFAGMPLCIPS